MKNKIIIILLISSLIICFGITFIINTFLFPKEGCDSTNSKLLNEIIEFGKSEGGCVCDGWTCEYYCEKYREIKHFNDTCEIGGVCIGSWC